MTDINIDHLFDRDRFPRGVTLFPLLLYAPLGCTIAIIRIFIGLHMLLLSSVLPHSFFLRGFLLRIMCCVLGIIVTIDGTDTRDLRVPVLISNHVSSFDHFVTDLVLPHIMLLQSEVSPALQWLFHLKCYSASKSREEVISFARAVFQKYKNFPLLFYPENTTTNGKVGLLEFSNTTAFEVSGSVQPITINVKRLSVSQVSVTTINSTLYSDIFWSLFVPFTVFRIRVLPVCQRQENESIEIFSTRVRGYIARNLHLSVTKYTASDKKELIKNEVRIQRSIPDHSYADNTIENQISPELNVMLQQVKETIPHVPCTVILKDLEITKDVDVTILNLLEGKVQYSSEEKTSNSEVQSKNSSSENSEDMSLTFKAKTFSSRTLDRHLSLDERKKAMYEMARKKYKEKHGIP